MCPEKWLIPVIIILSLFGYLLYRHFSITEPYDSRGYIMTSAQWERGDIDKEKYKLRVQMKAQEELLQEFYGGSTDVHR